MKDHLAGLKAEQLSIRNFKAAAQLFCELWPETDGTEAVTECHRILANEQENLLLATVDHQYLGFIFLSLRNDYVEGTSTSPVAYVEGIYVRPAFQKRGIASYLLAMGEDWGRKMGAQEMASDAELNNSNSIAFHLKSGFKEAQRVVCFAKIISPQSR